AVGQRNAGLRRVRAAVSTREAVAPWSERVVLLGSDLVRARVGTTALLAPVFVDIAGVLGLASATLSYEGDPPTLAELDARLELDLERGGNGAGPHLHEDRIEAGRRGRPQL